MALMWEVRAAEGRLDELVETVNRLADPSARLFRADTPEPRVVLIDPSDRGVTVPDDLVARVPHAWHFTEVTREPDRA